MIDRDDIMDAFYEGRRTAKYPLAVNDVVIVKQGRKPGERAAVITVDAPAPDVHYRVEYGDGSDDVVPLAFLQIQRPNQTPEPTR